ncbi:hypothetical protein IU433_07515 [Nocardia puris]|uniref:Uncharacterized protein n=1 Tax=Nocardia puris TaxID=208602 RepID=A0A366DLC6_9NOCA|nr:hypothetical protein [Nocardia puris]MBF6211387.1 hypothetical protein [Nocardia puris]MBF6365105.1 hypothetical protein [Nocardia puris]MBF6458890.1 hypothetical protein [Nocardia puris]RBO90745.1 hypothetical protein DFR74_105147 [Nocardia puris]
MNRSVGIALGEAVVVVVCLVLAVVCWGRGVVTTSFAAFGDVPAFDATRYVAPWIALAAFLVAVGGLFAIDAVARAVRELTSR